MPLRERLKLLRNRWIALLDTWFPVGNSAAPTAASTSVQGSGVAVVPLHLSAGSQGTNVSPPSPDAGKTEAGINTIYPAHRPKIVSTGTENDRTSTWPRLGSFLRTLDRIPLVFGPLKLVISELVECIEIYEVRTRVLVANP